jgi:6-phosphogluconolactonase
MAPLSWAGVRQGSRACARLHSDRRINVLALAMLLLSACGGSGSSGSTTGGSTPPPPPPPPLGVSMSASPLSVTGSATTAQSAPTGSFQVAISGAQQGQQLYLSGKHSTLGIATLSDASGPFPITVTIQFKSPASLGAGVYHDQVEVLVCYDQACTQQVTNSPQTVQVTYTVTAPPVTQLSSLSPTSAVAGGPAFTLDATGQNFTSQSTVQWNGSPRTTTFVSATQLTAQITASDIATAGSVPVTVSDPVNGLSNAVNFTIQLAPPTTASLLAVTNATPGTIDILTIDTTTGVPTPIAANPLPDGPTPSAVVIDPAKRFLYVASTSGEVRGYLINPSTLNLTPVSGSPFSTSAAQAVAIAIDPSGQFVVTANGSANTLSVFKIGSTGTLAEVAGSPFAAGADPSAIVFAPGQYVYAANTTGGSVAAYSMNVTSGALTPVAGSPFPAGGSPNGLVVDAAGAHVYATESQPNGVAGFTIDATTGALTAISGSPFAASYAISSPVMDAEGKRLHTANGTNIDCFLVDPSSALTEIGLSYTNGHAIALALDGPDNFMYVLDNIDNQIEVFSIDPSSGALTLLTGSPFALFPGASSQNLGPNAIAVQH